MVRRLFNEARTEYGDWQRYTIELTNYNREIRNEKRENFREFCGNMESIPVAARLHKVLAKSQVQESMSLKRPDGSYQEDEEQRDLFLLETHFPDSRPIEPGDDQNYGRPTRADREVAKEL